MNPKDILNINHVRKLADILNESNLTEIEYENNGTRIRVYKNTQLKYTNNNIEKNKISNPIKNKITDFSNIITSPMVGTVYHAPNPEAPNFIHIGEKIIKGQTLLVIESMKIMNPLRSPKSGIIKEILIHNAEPVEFDQPLLILE